MSLRPRMRNDPPNPNFRRPQLELIRDSSAFCTARGRWLGNPRGSWHRAWWQGACGSLTGLLIAGCAVDAKPVLGPPAAEVQGRDYIEYAIERRELSTGQEQAILGWLAHEVERNLARLRAVSEAPSPYFLGYEVVTRRSLSLEAQRGQIIQDDSGFDRRVDVDIRVGSPQLDNSRVRSGDYSDRGLGSGHSVSADDDRLSLAQSLWLATESQYRDARAALDEAVNDESLRSEDDDEQASVDFSDQEPLVAIGSVNLPELDSLSGLWRDRLEALSTRLAGGLGDVESSAALSVEHEIHHHVTSEGTRLQLSTSIVRLSLEAQAQADDGMGLARMRSIDVVDAGDLPGQQQLEAIADTLAAELAALRRAPIAEPYTGPAVLEGPAAGVFFHEIFGHRLEGHRQKSDDEGQTFTDQIGELVLPSFLQVVDDPTIATLAGTPLLGHYFVDNEGVAAMRTQLVEDGRLRNFLLSRSPVAPFTASNGHGRRAVGYPVVARQGNLIVNSARTVPESRLRAELIAVAQAAGKPYGLWFRDIDGGYTTTSRGGPQAFKVIPRIVYRVWTDGRPDELVRGVDIVGTPLSAFETIEMTGDQPGVFNGMCGAESGWVPVSAVSPSLLVSKLEIERAAFNRERPPQLKPPGTAADTVEAAR